MRSTHDLLGIERLIRKLVCAGYIILEESSSGEVFGNSIIELSKEGTSIRVINDRSRISVEVSYGNLGWVNLLDLMNAKRRCDGLWDTNWGDVGSEGEWLLCQPLELISDLASTPGLGRQIEEIWSDRSKEIFGRS